MPELSRPPAGNPLLSHIITHTHIRIHTYIITHIHIDITTLTTTIPITVIGGNE